MVGEFPVPGAPVAGGPANATERLVRGLARAGVEMTVIAPAPNGSRAETFRADYGEIMLVSNHARLLALRRMRPWRNAVFPLVEAAAPDVVHGQGVITGGAIAADAARLAASVVTVRGNARRDALAAYPGLFGKARAALADHLVKHVLSNVALTVNVHPDWRVNLPSEPRALVYVPNIVDEAFFGVMRAPVESRVLFCGGTRRIKGFDLLEQAWPTVRRAVPGATLRLAGWPDVAPRPQLPGVETVGILGPEALAEELSLAHLVVVPSRYEVSPILLAEAWAVGAPVVATSAGGMAALAPRAAVVVPPESPSALAGAIVDVLTGAVDTTEHVRAGRERAAAHREDEVVGEHLSIYDSIVRGS